MLNIVLYLIIIISFLGIILIIARKIPHLAHLSNEEVAVLSSQKGLIKKTTSRLKTINFSSSRLKTKRFFITVFGFLKIGLKGSKKKGTQTIAWLGKKTGSSGEAIKQKTKKVSGSIKDSVSSFKAKIQEYKIKIADQKKLKQEKEKEDILEKAIAESKEDISEEAIIEKDLNNKEDNTENESENESKLISFDDLDKPIEQEQKIIDLIVENPKNIIAYKALGLLYWKQCNYKDAKDSLQTACKLGSKDKKIKEVLEEIETKLGNDDSNV